MIATCKISKPLLKNCCSKNKKQNMQEMEVVDIPIMSIPMDRKWLIKCIMNNKQSEYIKVQNFNILVIINIIMELIKVIKIRIKLFHSPKL